MNGYFVAVVGIVVVFATAITISIIIAIIKGVQAGETSVEIQIAGIIRFSIRLSNISKKRANTAKEKEKLNDAPSKS